MNATKLGIIINEENSVLSRLVPMERHSHVASQK
jgi:hypothetical protein